MDYYFWMDLNFILLLVLFIISIDKNQLSMFKTEILADCIVLFEFNKESMCNLKLNIITYLLDEQETDSLRSGLVAWFGHQTCKTNFQKILDFCV